MALYEAVRHEALTDTRWDEGVARAAIERIVTDTYQRFVGEKLWPTHPRDRPAQAAAGLFQKLSTTDSYKMLYRGGAGVIWALTYLGEVGAITLKQDYLSTVDELLERNREDVRKVYPEVGSYLMGDVGILLLHWKLAPSAELAQQLYDGIAANCTHPAREFMWGAPGTMVAALFMLEWTGEQRWKSLFLQHCAQLWQEWEYAEEVQSYLWTQSLYGHVSKLIGAVHGFAGNVFPVIRGRHLLDSMQRDAWFTRIGETLEKTALREGAYVNWPQSVGVSRPGRTAPLVQHCHGAPGVITCLAELPEDPRWPVGELLERGGELAWTVGPLVKGPNLCHGTAGTGYAFLKLYQRTRNEQWLEHARRFAMHAIEQSERMAQEYGQRCYALWTGDLGLAVYLWDCIRGAGKFPTMEVF
jgi:lantibiotic modifying enzyme